MEIKEWRRLAIQSVSLLLVVFISCCCFSERLKGDSGPVVYAEEKQHDAENMEKQAEGITGDTEEQEQPAQEKKIVVIDAGHGGMDEGTSSGNQKHLEKDYTLLIVKRVKKLLEQKNITAYYTRMDDRNISKKARTRLANRKKADLFVSIHCNASSVGDTTAHGLETLYSARKLQEGTLTNRKLAKVMLEELTKATGLRKRGMIRREQLYLLHHAKVPTTIVEIGYMSNREDLAFMKEEEGQRKIAEGICAGILRALEEE